MREPKAVSQAERLYADEIEFQRFIQFKFYEQWNLLKEYVNSNGMEIIGDIPIYTAYDSADVWCEPELFQLDENRVPTVVAGFRQMDLLLTGNCGETQFTIGIR
jgi:4-alpha-glucanotransferase